MKLNDIVKNTLWFGIIPRLTILINLVVTPVITPFLTQSDYGVWGIISAYVGLISGFATLGLHIHLTNSYYEYGSNYIIVWRRLMFLMMIGSIISFFILCVLLMYELPSTNPFNRYVIVLLSSIPVLFNFNIIVAQHYYNLRLTPKPIVLRTLIGSLAGIISLLIAIYFFRLGYFGYILSSLVSSLLIFILLIKPIWINLQIYPVLCVLNKRTYSWFKIALPMMPHNVGHVILASSSRIIMSMLAIPVFDIGIFSHGTMFGEYASILIIAVITALSPIIQTTYRSKNTLQMKKILYLTEFIALFVIFFLSVWMREIYLLLIRNESLQIAHNVASYTCFSLCMYPLYSILVSIASIKKQTIQILWLVFFPAIISVILNFIFIPIYGYRAAIFVTIVSYWMIFIIALFVPFYRVVLKQWFGNPLKIIFLPFICLSLLVIAQFIGNLSLTLKTIFSVGLLCVIVYYILRNRSRITSFNLEHFDL